MQLATTSSDDLLSTSASHQATLATLTPRAHALCRRHVVADNELNRLEALHNPADDDLRRVLKCLKEGFKRELDFLGALGPAGKVLEVDPGDMTVDDLLKSVRRSRLRLAN